MLNDHLRKVREKWPGTKVTHYLSPESIYSLKCDATLDVSHKEHNVILLRCFVMKETDQWDVTERYLQFEEFSGKTVHEITEMILKTLEEHHIDIADCRGQEFDNGSNMSGKVKGVQVEIRKINPLAAY